jgi:fructokinase
MSPKSNFKIVGIGEVLWDLLPSGRQLGGAPGNFAYHAHALGATRVGADNFGHDIRQRFEQQAIANGTLQVDADAPTGTVAVTLSENGDPHYIIHENVAWDHLAVTRPALKAVREADAICFGSLAQRGEISRAAIQRLVSAVAGNSLRVFDVNLRQKYFSREVIEQSLRLANVLKLNDGELPFLATLFDLTGSTEKQIETLAQKFSLQVVALTRGPAGSLLFQKGRWSDCPSVPVKIVDTVGAGDSFTAALVMGLLNQMGLEEINLLANQVARYVCSCAGATPPLPKSICDRFVRQPAQSAMAHSVAASVRM